MENRQHIAILAIVGSLRSGSYNLQLARTAHHIVVAEHEDVSFDILEWTDVPLFNQDIEYPAPDTVRRVREQVKAADGLWLFTAEYNHFFPGVLKNLIDWLSRPVERGKGNVLKGKPIALSGASIGMHGTSHAQDHLATLLSYLDADIMNAPRLTIPYVEQQAADGILSLTTSQPFLDKQAEAYIAFIKEHKEQSGSS